MKYELSDTVREAILKIVAVANIKGNDAPIVMEIVESLGKPEKDKKDVDVT